MNRRKRKILRFGFSMPELEASGNPEGSIFTMNGQNKVQNGIFSQKILTFSTCRWEPCPKIISKNTLNKHQKPSPANNYPEDPKQILKTIASLQTKIITLNPQVQKKNHKKQHFNFLPLRRLQSKILIDLWAIAASSLCFCSFRLRRYSSRSLLKRHKNQRCSRDLPIQTLAMRLIVNGDFLVGCGVMR